MKKLAIVMFTVITFIVSSCKNSDEATPLPQVPADSENTTLLELAIPPVPILIAGLRDHSGFVNGAGSTAKFNGPHGIFVNPDGTILIADYENEAVRKINSSNSVSTALIVHDRALDVAVLNDGTMGILEDLQIEFYKSGAFKPTYHNCFHCTLNGIEKDPVNNYFWFTGVVFGELNSVNSYLTPLTSNSTAPSPSKFITNSHTSSVSVSAGGNKFLTADNGIFTCTNGGVVSPILSRTTFAGPKAIVTNRAGTKLYLADGRDIKLITRCSGCPTLLTRLVANVDASGLALSNSERVLYFTSAQHNTVSKINLP